MSAPTYSFPPADICDELLELLDSYFGEPFDATTCTGEHQAVACWWSASAAGAYQGTLDEFVALWRETFG